MTARSSTGKRSNLGAYFIHKLRSLRSMTILNGIFALLSYPLMMAFAIPFAYASIEVEKFYEMGDYESTAYYLARQHCNSAEGLFIAAVIVGFIMLAAMFLMNYVICSKSFRWLYKKSVVDMDYSLPVSDSTRFFGDLLASLTVSSVPHILAIAVGSGLYWALPFSQLGAELGDVTQVFAVLMQLVGTGLFSCIMFMGFSLLVMSLCGRPTEARIVPFVINIAIPVIHAVCVSLLVLNMYGYSSYGDYEYIGIAGTSPLGLLVMTVITLFDAYEITAVTVPMLRPVELIPLLIITVGAFAAAYVLIRRRRAERVGSPYVFPVVKTAIPAIVTFTVVSLFMAFALSEVVSGGVIVAMVIITFVLYIIMELISGRGFKKFHITLFKYFCTMIVSVIICVALCFTNGMGLARVVPDADEVAVAEISLSDGSSNLEYDLYAEVTDVDSLRCITEFHESLPKHYTYDGETKRCIFRVDYTLKSGCTLSREYELTAAEYSNALESIVSPEVYYNSEFDSFQYYLQDCSDAEVINVYAHNNDSDKHFEVAIPLVKLMEAVWKDCESIDPARLNSQYSSESADLLLDIQYRYHGTYGYSSYYTDPANFRIYSWYENTIALLEENGVEDIFDIDTDMYTAAFLLKIPTEDYLYYYSYSVEPYDLTRFAAILPVSDPESAEGYVFHDRYGSAFTARISNLPSDWELFILDPDDSNVRKLDALSTSLLPLDYSEPYVYVTTYCDPVMSEGYYYDDYYDDYSEKYYDPASESFVTVAYEKYSEIDYTYSVSRYVTAENCEKAEQLFDALAA